MDLHEDGILNVLTHSIPPEAANGLVGAGFSASFLLGLLSKYGPVAAKIAADLLASIAAHTAPTPALQTYVEP